ncbi:MAG: nucleoside-diphosphate kinase [Alphaproteobacteria bacterium]
MEQTLSFIKPNATARSLTGVINKMVEEAGLCIIAQKRLWLTKKQAEQFYAIHKNKPFFDELCTIISSEPIVAQVLYGKDAVSKYRTLMGATNPKDAEPGTIRQLFGESIDKNCVHGSDSLENAEIETAFFFSKLEIVG